MFPMNDIEIYCEKLLGHMTKGLCPRTYFDRRTFAKYYAITFPFSHTYHAFQKFFG